MLNKFLPYHPSISWNTNRLVITNSKQLHELRSIIWVCVEGERLLMEYLISIFVWLDELDGKLMSNVAGCSLEFNQLSYKCICMQKFKICRCAIMD